MLFRSREGLGVSRSGAEEKDEEDKALMEDNLNGDDEDEVLKEREDMGLGNDGRW